MSRRWCRTCLILLIALLAVSTSTWAQSQSQNGIDIWGPRYSPLPHGTDHQHSTGTDSLHHWNLVAVNASGLDHTPVAAGDTRVFGEQFGPGRASRAMAIVHIAMFEAANAIAHKYESYMGIRPVSAATSMDAAIAQAAHDSIVALFPSQASEMDVVLQQEMGTISDGYAKTNGIALGRKVAATVLASRTNDGSGRAEPTLGVDFFTSNDPGKWRQDPISVFPEAIGAYWGEVKPFVMTSGSQFRIPPPPAMNSAEYTAAFDEAKAFGGDGVETPTVRTAAQTEIGTYWAYDGTPSLCAPPRMYNQIVMHIADQMGTSGMELARLLALANVAMADTAIAVWDSKYFYDFWRPITGIRESDPGSGPTGLGDGNPDTTGDPAFMPLGAPASNLTGPNFTPPFPSYPSGHAGFGGAVFQTLRRFYGTDQIAFTFVSDEYNGVTVGDNGVVRPLLPRSFTSLSQAEEENGQSRIYLGIHWAFDKTQGIALGQHVGNYVFNHAFLPRESNHD